MFTSLRSDWRTPKAIFEMLNKEFNFDVDICATKDNALCAEYVTPEMDAFTVDWSKWKSIYCNPPYGRAIGDWVKRADDAAKNGSTVVMLIPSRTDTRWFHDYCLKYEIRFLCNRLNFDDSKGRAPFPSMVVVMQAGGGE